MSDEVRPIYQTFRCPLRALDSVAATFKWATGVHEFVTVSIDVDHFEELGRPGFVEITMSAS